MSAGLNGSDAAGGVDAIAARLLADVAAAFEEDIGERPTVAELVEVFGWAVPTREPSLDAPSAIVKFRLRRRGKARGAGPDESRVGDVGDATFAEASEAMATLARDLAASQGRPVTLAELASALAGGLRAASGVTSDAVDGVMGLDVVEPKATKRMNRGDIVVIPEGEAGYRFGVVLGKNAWGTALGLFSETFSSTRPPALPTKPIVTYPIHTDEQQLANGIWRVVGHDESLISLFPEPEIYHAPNPNSSYPELRGHGAAETADGRLRPISEEEARHVGLVDGRYDQGYLSEFLDRIISTIR